jgi:hypothetical protein
MGFGPDAARPEAEEGEGVPCLALSSVAPPSSQVPIGPPLLCRCRCCCRWLAFPSSALWCLCGLRLRFRCPYLGFGGMVVMEMVVLPAARAVCVLYELGVALLFFFFGQPPPAGEPESNPEKESAVGDEEREKEREIADDGMGEVCVF